MSNENNSERVTFEIGYSAAAEFKGEALFAENGPPENGKFTLFVLNYFSLLATCHKRPSVIVCSFQNTRERQTFKLAFF